MSDLGDDFGGLTNGNYGRTANDAMSNLSLDLGRGPGANRAPDDPSQDESGSEGFFENPLQRRASFVLDPNLKPTYIILHRVICERRRVDGEDHQSHPKQEDYLDVPRLFARDTRGSELRGQKPLINPQEYYDDHPEICAVVTKEYSCAEYHRVVKARFEVITTDVDKHIFNRMRPWLFRLREDGPPAESINESILISSALVASLSELAHRNRLGEWEQEHNLKAPYDYFYHFRNLLRRHARDQLRPSAREELEVLLDYIDETQGEDFDRIDETFRSGMVERDHFSKLFRPNDIILTIQEGHPRAFCVEKAYASERTTGLERQTITLDCWAWDFDGSFRKAQTSQIPVAWPSSNPPIWRMTSLSAWPLRLDHSNIRQRLTERGLQFWKCRVKRLVTYKSPTPTIFELQVVSLSIEPDPTTFPTITQLMLICTDEPEIHDRLQHLSTNASEQILLAPRDRNRNERTGRRFRQRRTSARTILCPAPTHDAGLRVPR
jgi:hypothetical protein